MDRTTRYVLIAGLLGATVVASGAVGRGSMLGATGADAYASGTAELQSPAVPYFPAQYVLDAPAGTSGQFSTF